VSAATMCLAGVYLIIAYANSSRTSSALKRQKQCFTFSEPQAYAIAIKSNVLILSRTDNILLKKKFDNS
jgi:prophage antirepressor-like protein